MGMIGSLFSGGTDKPNLVNPVSAAQLSQGYGDTQTGLAQQMAFIQALQGQNGIQNQSNVFNGLQGIVDGTGPNAALAQLNQSTQQNVANQAAMAAGQRGANANVGLLSRQAAMQGNAAQQNAIGQAASLQAQQQANAMQQQGNIAQNQVGNQAGAISGYNQFADNIYGNQLGAVNAFNSAQNTAQGNQNSANQALLGTQLGTISGIGQAATGTGGFAKSPAPQTKFDGGMIANSANQMPNLKEGKSGLSKHLKFANGGMAMLQGGSVPGQAKVAGDSPKNDTVPAILSPGEVVIPRSVMQSDDPAANAAAFVAAVMAKNKHKS